MKEDGGSRPKGSTSQRARSEDPGCPYCTKVSTLSMRIHASIFSAIESPYLIQSVTLFQHKVMSIFITKCALSFVSTTGTDSPPERCYRTAARLAICWSHRSEVFQLEDKWRGWVW